MSEIFLSSSKSSVTPLSERDMWLRPSSMGEIPLSSLIVSAVCSLKRRILSKSIRWANKEWTLSR